MTEAREDPARDRLRAEDFQREVGSGLACIERAQDGRVRIPAEGAMRAPVEFYVEEGQVPAPENLDKLVRIASTPGVVGQIDVLPDIHFKAKNFMPTGVAVRTEGCVVPMFVGPANDAMTLAGTGVMRARLSDSVLDALFAAIMARVAMFRRAAPLIDEAKLWPILRRGAPAVAAEWGFGDGDLARMDLGGSAFVPGAEPDEDAIRAAFPRESERPLKLPDFVPWHDLTTAGRHTLGVLDGGGHFLELNVVEEVYKPELSMSLGLVPGEVCAALHAGSADVGLVAHKHYLAPEDDEITTLPWNSERGRLFCVAQRAAANFAFANRLHIMAQVRETLRQTIGAVRNFRILSDVPHDLLDELPGKSAPIFVHRKGVVRTIPASAYPAGHPFARTGRPFYFPTSIGEDAYIMTRQRGDPGAFFTCSHGLGRSMSREQAMTAFDEATVLRQIQERNIRLYRYGHAAFSGQAPAAHKDTGSVLAMLNRFRLCQPVVRLRPLASLKA